MSKKFLAYDGDSIIDYNYKLYKIGRAEYWKRRVQFWKYRKKRTMGRPYIKPWKAKSNNTQEQP